MANVLLCAEDPFLTLWIDKALKELDPGRINIWAFKNMFAANDYLSEIAYGNVDILIFDLDDKGEKRGNPLRAVMETKRKFPLLKIILLSARLELATDIFEAEPCYFLLKPLEKSYLARAIRMALKQIEADKSKAIALPTRKGIARVRYDCIKYVDCKDRWLVVHELSGDHEIKMKMKELVACLPPQFLWCHQSFLVNMDRIHLLTKDGIRLYSGESIPISRARVGEVRKRFRSYSAQLQPFIE